MDYKVELDQFEGPLDLLLHLIKESNIDILDINIEEITKQYLDYINKAEQMNLDIASEYLVMSAELIEMKSRTLLPKREVEDDDEYEEDPREELIKRLIEYKNYKEVAPSLHDLESSRNEYYTKSPSLEIDGVDLNPEVSSNIDMDTLMDALNKFLKKKELDKPISTKITTKEYSVTRRSYEIKELLKTKSKVTFEELFDVCTRDYVVVTFLSVLNMAKNGDIALEQNDNFEELYIVRK